MLLIIFFRILLTNLSTLYVGRKLDYKVKKEEMVKKQLVFVVFADLLTTKQGERDTLWVLELSLNGLAY